MESLLLYFRRSLGKFETDFAFVQFQVRGKGAAFFGNEFREEIGLAGGDEFLDLLLWDFALQDHFADAEGAGFLGGDGVLAGVGII